MADPTLDQKLHDMDFSNKLYEYAQTVLGCSEEQADIFSRTMKHKFAWSGVRLLYLDETGNKLVAVDHTDQVREWMERKNFNFLLPPPKATVDFDGVSTIPADVLQAAIDGSVTAAGQIQLILSNGNGQDKDAAARTQLLIRTERTARANGAVNGGGDTNRHGQTETERRAKGTNPFIGLRDAKTGQINPVQMAKVASFIKAAGTKAAADVARAAGLKLDGTPIPDQYR